MSDEALVEEGATDADAAKIKANAEYLKALNDKVNRKKAREAEKDRVAEEERRKKDKREVLSPFSPRSPLMPQTSRFPLFLIPRKLVAALVNRHHPRVNTNSIPANTVLNTNPISTQMKQMEGYLEKVFNLSSDEAQKMLGSNAKVKGESER